jgi:hypothetical protein
VRAAEQPVHPRLGAEVGAAGLRPGGGGGLVAVAERGLRHCRPHLGAREQVREGLPEGRAVDDAVGGERRELRRVLARQPALERGAAENLLDRVASAVLPGGRVKHRRDDPLRNAPLDERAADDLRQRPGERRVDRALGLVGQDAAHRPEREAVQHVVIVRAPPVAGVVPSG